MSYTGRLPLTAGSSIDDVSIDGTTLSIHNGRVDRDYFEALQIPLLHGRGFEQADDQRGLRVAVVNETLARRGWPGGNAIGRTFRFDNAQVTVVGIARDVKYATLTETTPPFAYFPLAQMWTPSQALLVRIAGNPNQLIPAIQEAALAIDPGAPRPRLTSLRAATSIVLLPQRVAAIVTGALGAVGLLLATVGLYGIMAYAASRRSTGDRDPRRARRPTRDGAGHDGARRYATGRAGHCARTAPGSPRYSVDEEPPVDHEPVRCRDVHRDVIAVRGCGVDRELSSRPSRGRLEFNCRLAR